VNARGRDVLSERRESKDTRPFDSAWQPACAPAGACRRTHADRPHSAQAGAEDDKRFSVGIDCKHELTGLRVFAEYLSLTDYDHDAAADHDGSVIQLGATYDIGGNMLVGLMYANEDINDAKLANATDESEIVVAWNLKLDKKNKIFVEYVMQTEADTSQLHAGTVLKF